MRLSLYELTTETAALLDAIEDAGGEITPDVQARLDALGTALPAKANALCQVIRHFQARATALDLEAMRLSEAAARDEAEAKRWKDYLHKCMTLAGQRKVSTDLFGVSVCKNSVPSITWDSTNPLPERFRRVKVEVDIAAARQELKDTGELPEGFAVVHGSHIRIS